MEAVLDTQITDMTTEAVETSEIDYTELEAEISALDMFDDSDEAGKSQELQPLADDTSTDASADDAVNPDDNPDGTKAGEEPVKTTDDDTDDEVQALSTENPQREHFEKLEQIARARKKQIAELTAQIAEKPAAQEEIAATPPPPPPEQASPADWEGTGGSPELVVKALAMAAAGNEDAQALVPQAEALRDRLTVADLAALQGRAQAGEFGDIGEDVLDVVNDLSLRAHQNDASRAQQNAYTQTLQAQLEQNDRVLLAEHPSLGDAESDMYKSYMSTAEAVYNQFPALLQSPDRSKIIMDIHLGRNGGSNDPALKVVEEERNALQSENDQLKKSQAALTGTPLPPASSAGRKSLSIDQSLEQEMAAVYGE